MPEEHVGDLERDLAALLAVEPSPELAARVRDRIVVAPTRWRPSPWMWGAAAAGLILAAAVVGLVSRDRSTPATGVVAKAPPVIVVPDVSPDAPAPQAGHAPRLRRVALRRPPSSPPEPEIVVDPEVGLAVRRLVHLVNARAADDVLSKAGVRTVTDPPQELGVPPVVVNELAVTSITGSGRQ